jgi:hypothetical protein
MIQVCTIDSCRFRYPHFRSVSFYSDCTYAHYAGPSSEAPPDQTMPVTILQLCLGDRKGHETAKMA